MFDIFQVAILFVNLAHSTVLDSAEAVTLSGQAVAGI